MKRFLLLIFIACIIITHVKAGRPSAIDNSVYTDAAVKCKDEQGNSVDWYFAYKLPQIPDSPDAQYKEGSGYFYILPGSSQWKRSTKSINESDSIIGVTTQPLFQNDTSLAYLSYNDQPYDAPSVFRDGHTKGFAFAKSEGGVWLIHSVPHFPTSMEIWGYPPGGLINGQMFLCLSLSLPDLDNIGEILQYTKPNVYNHSVPNDMKNLLPKITDFLAKNLTIAKPPWFKQFQVTAGNLSFHIFAKGPKFRKEIFADWIAPSLRTSLDVQSWLQGTHPFQSNCTSANYSVMNILTKKIGGQNFTYEVDHAKWGVGTNDTVWSCMSDLNRMKPQKTRGGVALCALDKGVWSAFKASVYELQACNKTMHYSHQRKKNKNIHGNQNIILKFKNLPNEKFSFKSILRNLNNKL